MKRENLVKLVVSAMMIALSTALSFVTVYKLPLGGSVTLFSMLPVCMISILYGPMYAVLPCTLYGLIQMAVGGIFGWGLTPTILIGSILLDYIVAFGSLCLTGVFGKSYGKILGGIALAMVVRFVSHVISGYVLFANLEQWAFFGTTVENRPFLYSLAYNGSFMLPEAILTIVGAAVIFKLSAVKKLIK